MARINQNTFEVESVVAIAKDLATARRESRFGDALFHLEEILAVHMHTESNPLRTRCAELLAA